MRGEAFLSTGAFGEIPFIGDGWRGHAAEEAGELARGAEGCVLFLEEGLDEGEVVLGDLGGRGGGEGRSRFWILDFGSWILGLAVGAVAAGVWHVFAEVFEEVLVARNQADNLVESSH